MCVAEGERKMRLIGPIGPMSSHGLLKPEKVLGSSLKGIRHAQNQPSARSGGNSGIETRPQPCALVIFGAWAI